MKSKFTVTVAAILLLTQACSPRNDLTSPSPSPVPITPTSAPASPQVEMTPVVSTAVASSTLTIPAGATEIPPSDSGFPPEEGITLQDSGRTFTMQVGDSFLLNLGMDTYEWTVTIDNQNVLQREVGILVIRGAQGIYKAMAPGAATLTASGDPLCRQSQPACAIPSILFSVTIVVK